ncbi:universal stress protein [Mangrovimonas aestuarii]|uniref:universal stress protein n=1 Tax=Mangrovimonas aestuarii TaxID=3018443 RepID=UPI002379639D|nr:universal stress protein [Mangrovimonas aestuarii]
MKKILLPTDFSKNAWHAMCYAMELFKNDPCTFYVLNAFTASGYNLNSLMVPEPGEANFEAAKLEAENEMGKLMDMINFRDQKNPKHHFETITLFNSPVEAIKAEAEKHDIQLVIMGTKGATGSKGSFFGSNAVYVMEKVRQCPILVIPEDASLKLPKEIVFPTNYKINIKLQELQHLIEIAKINHASIRVLHVSKEDHLDNEQLNNKKLLQEYFEAIDHSFHSLSNINIQTAINCFVESRNSDMIAFINKKHMFFGSILSKPLVKGITYQSKVPILVMHDIIN